MARRKSGGSGVVGMLLMVCAVNFIGLLAMVGSMALTGLISERTFVSILDVFRGTHVAVPTEELAQLRETEKQAEKDREALRMEKGKGEVFADAVQARQTQGKVREEEMQLMLARLEHEQEKLAELRTEIEAGKAQAEEARQALEAEKEKETTVALSERTQRLQKTFANMDAADIATDLTALSKGGDEREEYAAHLLSLMKPTQVSEVLTEMDPEVRQRLLPLLENPYANMNPEAVAQEWKLATPPVSPRQMAEYFRHMPPTQAMKIWRKLDRVTREDVLEQMAPTQAEAR